MIGCLAGYVPEADAQPLAPRAFCEVYADAPDCQGRAVACWQCHTSTQPPAWNAYGGSILAALDGQPLEDGLADALREVESLDADGDGLSNGQELRAGSDPSDPLSQAVPTDPDTRTYDEVFAFRRVNVLFCGRSPDYDTLVAFEELSPAEQSEQIHETLSTCLDSEYYRDEVLRGLAHRKIQPVAAYGPDTDIEVQGFKISIADYEWDYRLWQWALTGDRDVRDLLTAQYHVDFDENGDLQRVEGVLAKTDSAAFAGGQPIPPERRAGMLTTQWNLVLNVMFSTIPRVAAAHAYREYLGLDLAQTEGIFPVEGEPLDIDARGVAVEACAECHSTLDPLAYAFAPYEGLDLDNLDKIGNWHPERRAARIPEWDELQPEIIIMDQPVDSLVEMAQWMAESPQFASNTAEILYRYAVGHPPRPEDTAEFIELWSSMSRDGYSANRLLHRIVDTEAFGGA